MKDTDYSQIIELCFNGSFFTPSNTRAEELCERSTRGEVISFKEITGRDIRFHRVYFMLVSYIWAYMPDKFKKAVPEKIFYQWLKHLKGSYDIKYEFRDEDRFFEIMEYCSKLGIPVSKSNEIANKFGKLSMIEYESISFGRMSEKRFREYVAEQLPFIYSNVIGKFFDGEIYDDIITNIEDEFEVFMSQLPG